MEDKVDHDGLRNKRRVRKRRPARKASAERETTSRGTVTAPGHRVKEEVSSGEEDAYGKGEDVSYREVDTSGNGEEHVSSRESDTSGKGGEHVSSRESDASGKGEERVSSRESDASGKGEEHVSSGEDDATSGGKDLGNTKTVLVQNPPVTRHKQKRRTSKFAVVRSKEISEDLRKQVVEAHNSGKGYKKIAKNLEMNLSTVKGIISKWKKFSTVATLPRSGRPTKISAQARNTILKHIRDNTRVTAKDLKASLALANINVHESTIRKTLNKWCSRDFTMEEEDTAVQQEK
ncbi:uncharacterized protein LOC120909941 [Rana temporaria]|uniref:uncharacterized protein LOC120909941 n=1 Tax=Rana temporaria TaxID=8407 RepID=UPI001AAD2801|nr:uncharacterized protein LOC120909941 [Rana temporaria]